MSFDGKDVNDMFASLDEKINDVFRNRMLMSVYDSTPRDYNAGEFMSELEAHVLGFIHKAPGITAKEICKLTYRTKGTISTVISKLEDSGFLEQRKNPDNQRERNLFLTETGIRASEQHRVFDRKMTSDFILYLSSFCTIEEINGYFKVIHYRSEYFEKIIEQEKKDYKDSKKAEKQ